jgi:hypothetical protein
VRKRVDNMRPSVVPGRPSPAVSSARLLEKKKEFEAVTAFETASTLFLQRMEGLGEDFDIMADAGEGSYTLKRKGQLF